MEDCAYADDFEEDEDEATPPPPPQPRQISKEELALGRQLGGGAFAAIYACTWSPAHGPPLACAAKVLVDASDSAAFHSELRALGAFGEHPNLLRLLGSSALPQSCFVTELLGPTLSQGLRHHAGGGLSLPLSLAADVTRGVAHLHALKPVPLLHRDIKPSNILLRGGPAPTAVLADFGLAGNRLSSAGTPTHMAPELFKEGALPTRASDVYALGCVLWSLLSGEEAWVGWRVEDIRRAVCTGERLSVGRVRGDTPPAVREALEGCWREDPSARVTAGALAACLGKAAAAAAAVAAPEGSGVTEGSGRSGGGGGGMLGKAKGASSAGGGDSLDDLFSAATGRRAGGRK